MSSDLNRSFTKENLDLYLKEVAKEYRKLGGKNAPAEIVPIGGAAILAGYEFRETTTDVDALMNAMSSMKEAINSVGDKFNLPSGWLNEDFKKNCFIFHQTCPILDPLQIVLWGSFCAKDICRVSNCNEVKIMS